MGVRREGITFVDDVDTTTGGAILDGVDPTIKATVFDYTNSNPLGVRLTDTNGDYVTPGTPSIVKATGTLTNNLDEIVIDTTGMSSLSINWIAFAGGFDGNAYVKVSNNGGTTYISALTHGNNADNAYSADFFYLPNFASAAQQYVWNVAGYDRAKVVLLDRTMGSATIALQASPAVFDEPHKVVTIVGIGGKAVTVTNTGFLKTETQNGSATSINDTINGPAAVKPASTAAIATDPALVVAISPNNSLAITAASLPLPTGASTAALQTQPGVDIGDVTVNNAAGAAAVNIQDGGNSITVDGTVAVSNAFALEATQINRTAFTKITDGTRDGTIKAASVLPLSTDTALVVTLRDSAAALDVVGTPIALNAFAAMAIVALSGRQGAGMFISAGTLNGTITPIISFNGGIDYTTTYFHDGATDVRQASITLGGGDPIIQRGIGVSGGATHIGVVVTAYISGTSTCGLTATAANLFSPVTQGFAAIITEPWSMQISDAITGPVSVKAASTAAVAADKALVVAISPNNTLTTSGAKSNNSVVPGATNLGVLPAIASSGASLYTEGFQVGLSTDLERNLRTRIAALVSDARESYINNEVKPLSLTSDGRLRVSTSPSDNNLDFFGGFNPYGNADDFGILSDNPYQQSFPLGRG